MAPLRFQSLRLIRPTGVVVRKIIQRRFGLAIIRLVGQSLAT